MITITIPGLRIHNPLNGSQGNSVWGRIARGRRRKAERNVSALALTQLRGKVPQASGYVVTLTRICVRPLDLDGCIAGMKMVRDSAAEFLGIDDGDPRIEWRYAQEKSKGYGVRIEIRVRGEEAAE